jgi:AraC-like DNA-binding protein
LPNTESLCFDGKHPPVFQIDQNNCVYLISKQEQRIAFNFARNQLSNTKQPISEDSENIIYKSLSHPTEDLLQELKKHPVDLFTAEAIKQYILKTKKYSTKVQ